MTRLERQPRRHENTKGATKKTEGRGAWGGLSRDRVPTTKGMLEYPNPKPVAVPGSVQRPPPRRVLSAATAQMPAARAAPAKTSGPSLRSGPGVETDRAS